ncbi:MAG: efflux RND transporter periplasmic adaptor subunit [Thermoguttaceae bacterium]|nr:efflux RND transporter periplasmic adaptor subunit [Thermoguttaceae bacterium]
MSRKTLLRIGTFAVAPLAVACLVASARAQFPGAGAPVRSTVVAGISGEAIPVTHKKYVGNVEAINEVDSVARVSGILTVAPGFEEGSRVSKGQLLFTIDPVPYQAKVDAAKASIQQLEAQIDYAQKNFDRVNDLYSRNAGSKNDMESAESSLLSLKAQLLAAQAQLVLAEEDLGYTQVKSEIDGRAGRRAYSTGNYVSLQSKPLVKVVQTDPIYVRFTMSERDYLSMYKNVDELKQLSKIQITLPNDETYSADGEALDGEIAFIDNTVKSTTDTIKVWAKFSNPSETLSPGGVVTVHLYKRATEQATTVEPAAVMFDGQDNYVYILVDSISDEDLYQEIKGDARFSRNVAAMEDGLTAVAQGQEAVRKFLDDHFDNIFVKNALQTTSAEYDARDPQKVEDAKNALAANQTAIVELCAALGQMKQFGGAPINEESAPEIVARIKSEGLDAWTSEYLANFKASRYVFGDQNDFADNKVDGKYKMVLRRKVALGAAGPNTESIVSGLEPNAEVVMDGGHKCRPFDLVVPVYRDQKTQKAAEQARAKTRETDSRAIGKTKKIDGKEEAKRVDAKKKVAFRAHNGGEAAA